MLHSAFTTGYQASFQALFVDRFPIDDELCDVGTTGPELAWLAHSYCASPRALVFSSPSPDWRLFVVTLPLASRLSLMANPIFAQLSRAWGMNVRFLGIDRDGLVHDFRALLTDRTLGLLVELLLRKTSDDAASALDLLFDTLAREMLTVLGRSDGDWSRHLATEHRLEPGAPSTLFDHGSRYPDFIAALRAALRNQIIDVALYGRALRSIDLRETAIDARIASIVESSLDPITVTKLQRTPAGLHLGAYNWLRIAPHRAVQRTHLLTHLPAFASFFAESLLPVDTRNESTGTHERSDPERESPTARSRTADLRRIASRSDTAASRHWSAILAHAVDAGQDRATISAIAQRFAVNENVIRRLWRERPRSLHQPPTWHLGEILHALAQLDERDWPTSDAAWRALMSTAVPAEAL